MDIKIKANNALEQLFTPIKLGPLVARSRVMMSPHQSAIGSLWGTEEEAAKNLAYLRLRAESGIAWATIPGRMRNFYNLGFEPSGLSAETGGIFRNPLYAERVPRFVEVMHEAGALAAAQFTLIGGYPHSPSATMSNQWSNQMPHVLTRDEVRQFVKEYGDSARIAADAGIDIFELHANHDDLHEWFLSPLTNKRTDEYGGDLAGRLRFTEETLRAMRAEIGPDKVLGVRMNMFEDDGYDLEGGLEIVRALDAMGLVDYFHMVIGTPWGNPSYIQPHFHEPGGWSQYARRFREAVSVPVVHTGLVSSLEVAARIIESGEADIVGMSRAHIADGELLAKAKAGKAESVRPCVGGNECINRRYTDGLPFGCAVNPHAGREYKEVWGVRRMSRDLVVVGGGPAGLELAALAAESGAKVTLFERAEELGGQLRIAANAPSFGRYGDYLDWQVKRVHDLGIDVRLGSKFEVGDEKDVPTGTVLAFATGAVERVPDIAGVTADHVLRSRDVISGRATTGQSVAVVVQDDHMPPIALAEHLAVQGVKVTMFYPTQGPAQLVGKYIVGSALGRLDALGVTIRTMEQVIGIEGDSVRVRHLYSRVETSIGGFDNVVLSCGGESDAATFNSIAAARPDVHVLGDAYAPRRLVFATRQAIALADLLVTDSAVRSNEQVPVRTGAL
ncbi:FAD-dependent oxidoreductase [Pseudarthrobacter sp. fls2-241-R2A-168]|uniref:FAD-dependent oxidoreductase n=1 Tax=Pseudarthrobacter sp. fls2-241-R2A-168 TaxID=3040304 RepID=UPI002552CFF1|nr:FAD-dependent oxidoreductase [Pseudarthrobacter sp. fls2-241-R2A-168]